MDLTEAASDRDSEQYQQAALPAAPQSRRNGGTTQPSRQGSVQNSIWPSNQSSAYMNTTKDVGQIVRRWDFRFSGDNSESIENFLTKVEDARKLSALSEEQILSSILQLFTGLAANWHTVNKAKWKSWQDFVQAARRWYGNGPRYQQRLMTEAWARTQGPGEPARDYITNIAILLFKMSPPMPEVSQLDLIHRNLLPNLQKQIRRAEFDTIEELLDLAVEIEQTAEAGRGYREPPPPESSVVPEAAYRPKPNQQQKQTPKIAAAAMSTNTKSEPADMLKQISKMIENSMAEYHKKMTAATSSNQQPNLNSAQQKQPPTSSPKENGGQKRGNGRYQNNRGRGGKTNQSRPQNPPQGENQAQTSTAPPPREKNGPIRCNNCGEIGYVISTCPNCRGNDKRGDQN